MSSPPRYFERIRDGAARRWDQLEQDAELAGPWHQLFKQVQSPRHILSELLQNADDAGATVATVRIEGGAFIFEHNGEDFSEEHFASLCRFGYSNKRSLHTIGFRGIGFKSTFSLGDQVELYTPSLSILFNRSRFTEPKWLRCGIRSDGKTCIRVAISDQHRQREVEKNLEEWLKSPVSLLFFKHIRRIKIGEQEVHWQSLGHGPIPDSEWMALHEKPDEKFLLIRSAPETFSDEALTEIRQERMLGVDEKTDFPPCKIEIVLGARGRLFVVLPTGVETTLPFACNAPFIQDPARVKIKSPDTSPTNRWLLERAGNLASLALLAWLNQSEMDVSERARAYGLFPDVDRADGSLEGVCGTIVEEIFGEGISGQPLLLTQGGALVASKQSVILPEPVCDVWPQDQASALFDGKGRPPLCREIDIASRKKLLSWGLVEELGKESILRTLQTEHLPQPKKWYQLLHLWAYIAPEIVGYLPKVEPNSLRIIPVQGKEVLYSAIEVVRLAEKKLLHSDADWQFLAEYLIVLNQNWPRYLAKQSRDAEGSDEKSIQQAINSAYAVLKKIGLDDTSDASKVIDRISTEFFAQESISLAECVHLAQIAAKLGATVGNNFRYVTRGGQQRASVEEVFFDADGTLEELVPDQDRNDHLLHPGYTQNFSSCSDLDWWKWVFSGRSKLLTFIPFVEKSYWVFGREKIEFDLRRRGLQSDISFPYTSNEFRINDWDFADACWCHWESLSAEDGSLWGRIAERIILQPETSWSGATNCRSQQIARNGWCRQITNEPLFPSWILKLRDLPCLPDTRGFYHKPCDLLRRTPETEALMDVEPFIHARLDREGTRLLLDLLGVRNTPTGPDRLLKCLRALSRAENPPIHEVEKWYRCLDQLMDACSTSDIQKIREAFRSENLILTAGGSWAASQAVFLASDEDAVPGADVIRSSVEYLSFWRKIDVAERPSAELAIHWLQGLPTGKSLSQDDARRVNALIKRHPTRIWDECGHWLNLAGEWAPVGELNYALTMQSLIAWAHLHEWVKQKTANLRSLTSETVMSPPFSVLSSLASVIENRLHCNPRISGRPERKPWLSTLGEELRRIELDDDEDMARTRQLAYDLVNTEWQDTPGLEIIPYLGGTPAGTPQRVDVIWANRILYVDGLSKAKLARRVPEEIGSQFNRPEIKDALVYSFDRPHEDILAYMEENFSLAPRQKAEGIEDLAVGEPVKVEILTRTQGMEKDLQTETEPLQPEGQTKAIEPEPSAGSTTDEEGTLEPAGNGGHTEQHRQEKPQKPGIIERFAQAQGFRKESDDSYYHTDGHWIAKSTNGSQFPWELRNAMGVIVRYLWPKDLCLQREPLQIPAEMWSLCELYPEKYSLILSEHDGTPVEISGKRLTQMRELGELTVYPAMYLIVQRGS